MNDEQIGKMLARSVVIHAVGIDSTAGQLNSDMRGVTLLEAAKALKRKVKVHRPSDSELEAMAKHDHPRRVPGAAGPLLLLFGDTDASQRSVFEVPSLLIHPEQGVRRAALRYLENLGKRCPTCISESSRQVLRENKTAILRRRPSLWYIPAETATATLENDFLLNLAGFQQSLVVGLPEIQNDYWQHILFPKAHPARYIPSEAFRVVTDPDLAAVILEECAKQLSLAEAVEMFFTRLGHLPLPAPHSLGSLIAQRADAISSAELFHFLCGIASSANTLHAYHGCQTLCDRFDGWSDEQKATVARLVSRFVAFSLAPDEETPEGRAWTCRQALAQHFLRWCELHGPGWGGDTLCGVAWWLAERVAEVLLRNVESEESPVLRFRTISERCLQPARHLSERIATIACSTGESTPFRLFTLQQSEGGPWAVSLVTSLGAAATSINRREDNDHLTDIDRILLTLGAFPNLGRAQPGSLLFHQAATRRNATEQAWAAEIPDEMRQYIDERRRVAARVREPEECSRALSEMLTLEPRERLFLLYAVLAEAQAGQLPEQPVWEWLTNPETLRDIPQLSSTEMDILVHVFLFLQNSDSVPWRRDLPQILTAMLNTMQDDDERCLILFYGILASASASSSYSAIRQVRAFGRSGKLGDLCDWQRQYLLGHKGRLPVWTWAKLRPILANLR